MAEKTAASRSLLQAAYTPIKLEGTSVGEKPEGKAWDKWRFFAHLRMTIEEAKTIDRRLRRLLAQGGDRNLIEDAIRDLKTLLKILPEHGTPNALKHVKLFAEMSSGSLTLIAQQLVELREERAEKARGDIRTLCATLMEQPAPKPAEKEIFEAPENWKRLEVTPFLPAGREIFHFEKSEPLPEKKLLDKGEGELSAKGVREIRAAMTAPPQKEAIAAAPLPIFGKMPIGDMLEFARANNIEPKAVDSLSRFLVAAGISMEFTSNGAIAVIEAEIDRLNQLIDGFQERMKIEPVGFLHLERLTFTPAGIEQGELVYSLPLAPGEEVNIAHKEWSHTSEEFEKIVEDFFEGFSEEGVAEKSEITESTGSQKQHSSGFDTGVTASGGYGPVDITATASYNVSDSATKSEQHSINQSVAVTRKASSRTKKEHKISFKVASASGVEEEAVRKIVNPDRDKPNRVDYYQLIRKWKVNLYRYGVRLTYDITIPEPGSDILSKIVEIKELDDLLELEFDFSLNPNTVTRNNYLNLAAEYNAAVPSPPDEWLWIDKIETKDWASKDEAKKPPHHHSFELDVDKDYEVWNYNAEWDYWFWEDEYTLNVKTDFNSWLGKSGTLGVLYETKHISDFVIEIELTCRLKDEVYRKWKLQAWEAMRSAAEASYLETRKMLKERRDRLIEEVGVQDALTLRKVEREEVMKGVLRWLFGPTFEFVPAGLPADLYTTDAAVVNDITWSRILSFGEFIKFLHQSIEWENMLYFLYPYFWSHQTRWELKKYLDHPDSMHRVFLKSGSARVVLTVRPGFEEDFLSVLETGIVGGLPSNHPYLRISDEIRAFAETNYPGIPASNPITDSRPLIYPKQRTAWEDIQKLFKLLEAFHAANGRHPTEDEGLAALSAHVTPDIPEVPLVDPWGNNYVYTHPGSYAAYDLVSLGADGSPGGAEENADITSWATASHIATWNEYTPTSAMDIRFGEEEPSA